LCKCAGNLNKKRYRLKKSEILRKREIKNLLLKGKRYFSKNLTIIYLPALKQKAGFIASRQIRQAVKRNRVKRILREAYRMNKGIFEGLQVIFLAQGELSSTEVIEAFVIFNKEGKK